MFLKSLNGIILTLIFKTHQFNKRTLIANYTTSSQVINKVNNL